MCSDSTNLEEKKLTTLDEINIFFNDAEEKNILIKQISNHDNDNLISLENNIIYKIINVVIKYYDNHKLDSDLSITSIDDTKSLIKALNEYNILFNE